MSQACPQCGSNAFKRNGYTRHGKQNHRCLNCGRQFSLQIESVNLIQHPIEIVGQTFNDDQSSGTLIASL